MGSRHRFQNLPPELRNKIYNYYFHAQGGYILSFAECKLIQSDGTDTDLALISTCRQIYDETHHLPLDLNTVTISTVGPLASNWRSQVFHRVYEDIRNAEARDLASLIHSTDADFSSRFIWISPPVDSALQREFPEHIGALRHCKRHDETQDLQSYGLPQHIVSKMTTRTLELVAGCFGKKSFSAAAQTSRQRQSRDHSCWGALNTEMKKERERGILSCLSMCHEPWMIPKERSLNRMRHALMSSHRGLHDNTPDIPLLDTNQAPEQRFGRELGLGDKQEDCFSAAAVTAWFLGSLRPSTRQKFRNIIVHENGQSSPHPECHGQALIRFCRESPLLRIDRQLDLASTILSSVEERPSTTAEERSEMEARLLSRWMVEAMDIRRKGILGSAFCLTLKGGHDPYRWTQVMETGIKHILEQQLSISESTSWDSETGWGVRCNPMYFADGLPLAIRELGTGDGMIRCDFDSGAWLTSLEDRKGQSFANRQDST